jgi:hypothetical protein
MIWMAAARFRFIRVWVPFDQHIWGDPEEFTGHLVEVACLLGKCWEDCCMQSSPTGALTHYIKFDLRYIFHEMLPFNLESQGEAKYGHLLNWLQKNYPRTELDFDNLAAVSERNLKKIVSVARLYQRHAQWTLAAYGQVPERDEGGATALSELQISCARNGVAFELQD